MKKRTDNLPIQPLKKFSRPLSDFSRKVLETVRKVPAGRVVTYESVAEAVGRPRSARAVANVLAKNFNPKIPCHRVVRSDGRLGGYNRGGAAKKAQLLRGEGVVVKAERVGRGFILLLLDRLYDFSKNLWIVLGDVS